MSVFRLLTIFMMITIIFSASCTKTAEGTTGPAGPAGSNGQSVVGQRSGIYGYVLPVNQYTVTDTTLDSFVVSTRMGDSVVSVLTDKTGKFILPGLTSGTYRIMFKKNGYDSIGRNIDHTGGNEDQFIKIVQIDGTQTTHISGQTLQLLQSPFDNVSKYLDVQTTITGPVITYSQRYIDFYFSSSRNLNTHDNLYMFQTYTHGKQAISLKVRSFSRDRISTARDFIRAILFS